MSPLKTILSTLVLALAVLLQGCASAPAPKASTRPQASAADTVLAEIALKRGDCKGASESYAKAASSSTDASLARRASEVSLGCEHLPAAWESVKRWRMLAPQDREATALYAAVALKLYKVPEAREAVLAFAAEKPLAGTTQDTGFAALAALLLQHADASAVLAAMSALESQNPSPLTLSLLGELALDSFDSKRAEHYADEGLQHDPKSFEAKRVLARAYVLRGDAAKAIATAREATRLNPAVGAFELAQILTDLDRTEEAHQELERLRNTSAPKSEIDRRLALLAYDSGDFGEAEQRFSDLASDDGAQGDASLLYLADIAARGGDSDVALAAYRKLEDSSVAIQARSRAAALLMARNDRSGALALLDDYAASHPSSEFDLTITKARLLADHGEPDTGLSLLGAALDRHPNNPSIQYDRAVILEHAGRVHESVEVLEKLLAQRPDDPVLTNALGYTLADHNLELPRAEGLIERALAVSPDSPAILDSLGWVKYREGDAKDAVPTLARAYSIQHDSEIGAHWGEAVWMSGEHAEARRIWSAALARDPSSQPLRAALTRFIPETKDSHSSPPPKQPSGASQGRREPR